MSKIIDVEETDVNEKGKNSSIEEIKALTKKFNRYPKTVSE